MTDKEIMIDSIDVSGCEFLWKERLPRKVCNNGNLDCDCISNPNCYYKQLKRKEQKLEKIKDICNTYQMEYMVNNGVNLLTTKILQIIEGK